VSRRRHGARWIVVAAALPQIIVAFARPTPRGWTSWVSFALLLYIGWLALNLPKPITNEDAQATKVT